MGFHKAAGATKPTALGSMLQASTYGQTIPMIFGRVTSPLLAIWAAHFREGGTDKKGKGWLPSFLSPPSYVENLDFLLGSNPILGVLQMWRNKSDFYPLNIVKVSFNVGLMGYSYHITDPNFYAVIGVTTNCTVSGTFNDYGGNGSQNYSDAEEFPMWNCAMHGPEITDQNSMRLYPYTYAWTPAQGPFVSFPFGDLAGQGPSGILFTSMTNIYYAQLSGTIGHHSPLTKLRLEFESSLGNNAGIYSPAPSQRITYPQYAGVGSSNLDLGMSGMIPSILTETMGSHCLFPTGDAEFPDMIEEVVRSGVLQTGAGLGFIQRGLNCNGLPGPVQKDMYAQTVFSAAIMNYFQPNRAGSILLTAGTVYGGGLSMPISDTAGNTWVRFFNYYPGAGHTAATAAYVNGCLAAGPGNQVTINGYPGENPQGFILELDPSLDTIDTTATSSGGTGTASCSINTAGPAFIVAFLLMDIGNSQLYQVDVHWTDLFAFGGPMAAQHLNSGDQCFGRWVSQAGTYTVTFRGIIGTWNIVMIDVMQSQPPQYPKALGNIIDVPSMNQLRLQCRAGGLQGSLSMQSQRDASDWLKDMYMCADGAPVWSGFKLKSIPRSEASAFGQGSVYTAPTASGPIATLKESSLIGDSSKPLVVVDRKAQLDANNILQIQHLDRNNRYNPTTSSQPESGAIALYGPRKQSPTMLDMIVDPSVARKILAIEVRRLVYLRNTYKFTMQARYLQLEAMDLILINDSLVGITNLPVRLTSIEENDSYELECEAEPFIYGVHAPNPLAVTTAAPYVANPQAIPGAINVPIFIEPPGRMCLSGGPELWAVVSDSDPIYGGALVYISLDGGTSYQQLGIAQANATTGIVTLDWPLATDPDAANSLKVDLTESLGALTSFDTAIRDSFAEPCYVQDTPAPTPTLDAVYAGDYEGNANMVPGGSPKKVTSTLATVSGCVPFVAQMYRGQMAFFYGNSGAALWGYPDSNGNFDWNNSDPRTMLIPFSPGVGDSQRIFQTGSGGLAYDFAQIQFNIHNAVDPVTGKKSKITVYSTSGSGTLTLVVAGRTFTISSGGFSVLMVVQIDPTSPGNPPLLLAFSSYTTGTDTGDGWTLKYNPPDNTPGGAGGNFLSFSMSSQNGIAVSPGANYELMSYATATLTSAYNYTMPPTTRRGVFGMGPADHAISTRFAFLGGWMTAQTMPGVYRGTLDPSWIGKTLYFKFVPYNNMGGGLDELATALAAATAYQYTPIGLASGVFDSGSGTAGGGTQGNPNQTQYTITGGALTNPTPTTIVMAQAVANFGTSQATYTTRTFTIPTPTALTTYYVTIYDPGQVGDGTTTLQAQAQVSNSLVGVPGYVYIGSIKVLPAGSGTVTGAGGYPNEIITFNGV